MLRFAMSGGNFMFSQGACAPGIWSSAGAGPGISSTAPAGRNNTFAFTGATTYTTPNLGGNFGELIAGYAFFVPSLCNNQALITFKDASGNTQCDVRINGSGQLFFTRNGTVIGSTSTFSLTALVWSYIEFRAIFSTSGAGTCEVRVNGVTVLSSTGLTNATTTVTAALVMYSCFGSGTGFVTDFYA